MAPTPSKSQHDSDSQADTGAAASHGDHLRAGRVEGRPQAEGVDEHLQANLSALYGVAGAADLQPPMGFAASAGGHEEAGEAALHADSADTAGQVDDAGAAAGEEAGWGHADSAPAAEAQEGGQELQEGEARSEEGQRESAESPMDAAGNVTEGEEGGSGDNDGATPGGTTDGANGASAASELGAAGAGESAPGDLAPAASGQERLSPQALAARRREEALARAKAARERLRERAQRRMTGGAQGGAAQEAGEAARGSWEEAAVQLGDAGVGGMDGVAAPDGSGGPVASSSSSDAAGGSISGEELRGMSPEARAERRRQEALAQARSVRERMRERAQRRMAGDAGSTGQEGAGPGSSWGEDGIRPAAAAGTHQDYAEADGQGEAGRGVGDGEEYAEGGVTGLNEEEAAHRQREERLARIRAERQAQLRQGRPSPADTEVPEPLGDGEKNSVEDALSADAAPADASLDPASGGVDPDTASLLDGRQADVQGHSHAGADAGHDAGDDAGGDGSSEDGSWAGDDQTPAAGAARDDVLDAAARAEAEAEAALRGEVEEVLLAEEAATQEQGVTAGSLTEEAGSVSDQEAGRLPGHTAEAAMDEVSAAIKRMMVEAMAGVGDFNGLEGSLGIVAGPPGLSDMPLPGMEGFQRGRVGERGSPGGAGQAVVEEIAKAITAGAPEAEDEVEGVPQGPARAALHDAEAAIRQLDGAGQAQDEVEVAGGKNGAEGAADAALPDAEPVTRRQEADETPDFVQVVGGSTGSKGPVDAALLDAEAAIRQQVAEQPEGDSQVLDGSNDVEGPVDAALHEAEADYRRAGWEQQTEGAEGHGSMHADGPIDAALHQAEADLGQREAETSAVEESQLSGDGIHANGSAAAALREAEAMFGQREVDVAADEDQASDDSIHANGSAALRKAELMAGEQDVDVAADEGQESGDSDAASGAVDAALSEAEVEVRQRQVQDWEVLQPEPEAAVTSDAEAKGAVADTSAGLEAAGHKPAAAVTSDAEAEGVEAADVSADLESLQYEPEAAIAVIEEDAQAANVHVDLQAAQQEGGREAVAVAADQHPVLREGGRGSEEAEDSEQQVQPDAAAAGEEDAELAAQHAQHTEEAEGQAGSEQEPQVEADGELGLADAVQGDTAPAEPLAIADAEHLGGQTDDDHEAQHEVGGAVGDADAAPDAAPEDAASIEGLSAHDPARAEVTEAQADSEQQEQHDEGVAAAAEQLSHDGSDALVEAEVLEGSGGVFGDQHASVPGEDVEAMHTPGALLQEPSEEAADTTHATQGAAAGEVAEVVAEVLRGADEGAGEHALFEGAAWASEQRATAASGDAVLDDAAAVPLTWHDGESGADGGEGFASAWEAAVQQHMHEEGERT